jgi:transcriptional regulator with XRE-family HTH domain
MTRRLRGRSFIHNVDMANPKKPLRKTFIREWRKHNNLTLDQLVDRLDVMYGLQTTGATLSRTETGKQEYTQQLLEAIADALGCEPADLLMRPPGASEDIRIVWTQLSPENQKRALEIIRVLKAS